MYKSSPQSPNAVGGRFVLLDDHDDRREIFSSVQVKRSNHVLIRLVAGLNHVREVLDVLLLLSSGATNKL